MLGASILADITIDGAPRKDELIAAFAESENLRFWRWWDGTVERYADTPSRQLRALLEGIGEQIASPQFRGCPFINLANEFPDPEHPGTASIRTRLSAKAAAVRAFTASSTSADAVSGRPESKGG
jgi:hypothetical protein